MRMCLTSPVKLRYWQGISLPLFKDNYMTDETYEHHENRSLNLHIMEMTFG